MSGISPSDANGKVWAWNTQTHVLQEVSSQASYTIGKTITVTLALPNNISAAAKAGLAGYSFPVEVNYSGTTATNHYAMKVKSGNADITGGTAFADTPSAVKWNVVFDASGDIDSGASCTFVVGFDGASAGNTWGTATTVSDSASLTVQAQS